MEHLDIRSFGKKKDKPDVTILVAHDGSIDDLSKEYPDIYNEVVQAMEPSLSSLDPKKMGKKKGQSDADVRYETREQEKEQHQNNREDTEEKLQKLLTIEQDLFATEAA